MLPKKMIYLFHNQRCAKSRECYAFLHEAKIEFQIIKYMEKPPSFDQLKLIISKLNIPAIKLIRIKEPLWKTTFRGKPYTEDQLIEIMINNPILMQRPILINGAKAIIAIPFDLAKTVI